MTPSVRYFSHPVSKHRGKKQCGGGPVYFGSQFLIEESWQQDQFLPLVVSLWQGLLTPLWNGSGEVVGMGWAVPIRSLTSNPLSPRKCWNTWASRGQFAYKLYYPLRVIGGWRELSS